MVMRPVLRRLLSRPSSLEFLRYLVGRTPPVAIANRNRQCYNGGFSCRRHTSSAAIAGCVGSPELAESPEPSTVAANAIQASREPNEDQSNSSPLGELFSSSGASNVQPSFDLTALATPHTFRTTRPRWVERLFTYEELDFESDLDAATDNSQRVRLLDQAKHANDLELWACLLGFRKRIYGSAGILTFWNAVLERNILLPTDGGTAHKFWSNFLNLGFEDESKLVEVLDYAASLREQHKRSWSKLYVYTVQHFLASREGDTAWKWHRRLLKDYPPQARNFADMCRYVISKQGDLKGLQQIYLENEHRNCYSRVIPSLCERENFKAALYWHYLFLEHGDLPSAFRHIEPLVHFLAIYDPTNVIRVNNSLRKSRVPFVFKISKELPATIKISREMMNLIHGRTFHIPVKQYNDSLGARWFATGWVSLEIAMNSVHALGVQEIGPLSLQSIALRDSDPKSILFRINQLRTLGISTGESLFSRAVEHFAKLGKHDLLQGLLKSDLHPDELEDAKLQEDLLSSYARSGDWTQYQLCLEIRSLASKAPEIEKSNLELRSFLATYDTATIFKVLIDMESKGIPVQSKTIALLLHRLLRPRQRGRRPMTLKGLKNTGQSNDLNVCISILKRIMGSGSFVPIFHWREILRRLGMVGRFQDLERLCLYLATWYGSANRSLVDPLVSPKFRVPMQVLPSHPLHPLKILFNPAFQRAVVEWGFIHSLRRPHGSYLHSNATSTTLDNYSIQSFPKVTGGLTLLKQLSKYGVHIQEKCVRKAIFDRLITYFGPGNSNKPYNRYAKHVLRGRMGVVARQVDDALGGEFFTAVDLPKIVQKHASTRLRRLQRRSQRASKIMPLPRGGAAQIY